MKVLVNARGNFGETALMRAIADGHLEIVKLLIANGADVNAHNNFGSRALMRASYNGHLEIERLLIANGAV